MIEKSLKSLFEKIYELPPDVISSSPGRINIIGEHTDYNQGYVLPAAVNLRIYFLASIRDDEKVLLWAENFKKKDSFSLESFTLSEENRWADYIRGIYWVLGRERFPLKGVNALIWGNIPLEAGLSSSAALEISIINSLDRLFRLNLTSEKKAFLAQKAENDFVGVKCGIMDQFISLLGQKDKALFLDCETLSYEFIPLNFTEANVCILVYDSRVSRSLASSEYNKRRQEAAEALQFLKKRGHKSFKEVDFLTQEEMRKGLNEVIYRRAKHVINENMRVKKAVQALREDDFSLLGELLFLSHESLRDDYEVSCPELDLLYETGKDFTGCLGARLTGAGFGGSGIALVKKESAELFRKKAIENAEKKGFNMPEIYEIEVGEGAKVKTLK
ncbi:MAG: galactokinase [Candidatus Aminicenantaceae bacterium]